MEIIWKKGTKPSDIPKKKVKRTRKVKEVEEIDEPLTKKERNLDWRTWVYGGNKNPTL